MSEIDWDKLPETIENDYGDNYCHHTGTPVDDPLIPSGCHGCHAIAAHFAAAVRDWIEGQKPALRAQIIRELAEDYGNRAYRGLHSFSSRVRYDAGRYQVAADVLRAETD